MPEKCEICKGRGVVFGDDGAATTCRCVVIRSHMATVKHLVPEATKLGRGCLVERNPIEASLLLCKRWRDAMNDLAGWIFRHLCGGHITPRVLVLDTTKLREMYKSAELSQLRAFDLVVARVLPTQTNKMLPDVLIETVGSCRALWLVSSPGDSLGKGHPAWSSALDEMVEDWPRLGHHDADAEKDAVLLKLGVNL